MKKFVYICGMMLLCINVMAQIDPYDKNWECVLSDDFVETNRQFDNSFQEPLCKWISYAHSLWPSGVTKIPLMHIYQWDRCLIDASNSVIKLNSSYIRNTPITCSEQPDYYILPPNAFGINYHCDDDNTELYYYSGMIESLPTDKFRYGYFEIKCKLPVHQGAFPAFWLWDAKKDLYYEEIDIFEVSKYFTDPSMSQWTHNPNPQGISDVSTFTTGLYYNEIGSYIGQATSQARNYPIVPTGTTLNDWHTFACEWLPDHVIWYCDGDIVNEYHNSDSIPHHALTLKANYAIDNYALQNQNHTFPPAWCGNDNVVIDFINVYQLNYDCETDEEITRQSELEQFNFGVKKSIRISSTIEQVYVTNNDKVTFRATDYFQITGPFQTDLGGEMTVIMQICPE